MQYSVPQLQIRSPNIIGNYLMGMKVKDAEQNRALNLIKLKNLMQQNKLSAMKLSEYPEDRNYLKWVREQAKIKSQMRTVKLPNGVEMTGTPEQIQKAMDISTQFYQQNPKPQNKDLVELGDRLASIVQFKFPEQKPEKLYSTTEGWLPRSQAVGKKKPEKKAILPTTSEERAYSEYVKMPGKERTDKLTFHRMWTRKNPETIAISMALRDPNVLWGDKTLADSYKEILNVMLNKNKTNSNQADPYALREEYQTASPQRKIEIKNMLYHMKYGKQKGTTGTWEK